MKACLKRGLAKKTITIETRDVSRIATLQLLILLYVCLSFKYNNFMNKMRIQTALRNNENIVFKIVYLLEERYVLYAEH